MIHIVSPLLAMIQVSCAQVISNFQNVEHIGIVNLDVCQVRSQDVYMYWQCGNPSCCSHQVTNMPRTSTVMSLLLIFILKGLMKLSIFLHMNEEPAA